MKIYSIGHSTHEPDAFKKIAGGLFTTLIDIRSHPTSRWEQWRKDEIPKWLDRNYEWWPSLGGWTSSHLEYTREMKEYGVDILHYVKGAFPKHIIAQDLKDPPKQDPAWTNRGLRDYSYFMATHHFLGGVEHLIRRLQEEKVAIMCCEALWWKCHRSLVADYLHRRGVEVIHIMPNGKGYPHAKAIGNRLERYEPFVTLSWKMHEHTMEGRPQVA